MIHEQPDSVHWEELCVVPIHNLKRFWGAMSKVLQRKIALRCNYNAAGCVMSTMPGQQLKLS